MTDGAVVTGAARGLGFEIARVLARRGLTVHLSDVNSDAATAAAGQLGGSAFSSVLDVRDFEACRGVARATVERAGSLAVWVNNAGVLFPGAAWEQDEATRRTMIDINALGTMNGTLAALEEMRAAGSGHVINVVSLAGLIASPGETVYSASKHAAIAFSLGTQQRRPSQDTRGVSCPNRSAPSTRVSSSRSRRRACRDGAAQRGATPTDAPAARKSWTR